MNNIQSTEIPSNPKTLAKLMAFYNARQNLPDIDTIDPVKKAKVEQELAKEKGTNWPQLVRNVCSNIFLLTNDKEKLYIVFRYQNYYWALPLTSSEVIKIFKDVFWNHSSLVLTDGIIVDFFNRESYLKEKAKLQFPVHKRSAQTSKTSVEINLVIDGKVAVVCPEGYAIKRQIECQSQFIKRSESFALYEPVEQGQGDLQRLWKFMNVSSEHGKLMVLSCCLYSWFGKTGYPFVSFVGQAGSGKSEALRFLVKLIDNTPWLLRSLSENEQDVAIACASSQVVAFDNISDLSPKMSNTLCKASTEANNSNRKHYTNDEEVLLPLNNPIFATSISIPITKPDLMDRAITIACDRFEETMRRPQSELNEAFELDAPFIMGGLLDLLSRTLGILETFQTQRVHRLADFSKFGQCMAIALGKTADDFLNAFEISQRNIATDISDSDCLLQPLLQFLSNQRSNRWEGTTTQLFNALGVPDRLPRDWPGSAAVAGKRFVALQPVLNVLGVDYKVVESGKRKVLIELKPSFDRELYSVTINRQITPAVCLTTRIAEIDD